MKEQDRTTREESRELYVINMSTFEGLEDELGPNADLGYVVINEHSFHDDKHSMPCGTSHDDQHSMPCQPSHGDQHSMTCRPSCDDHMQLPKYKYCPEGNLAMSQGGRDNALVVATNYTTQDLVEVTTTMHHNGITNNNISIVNVTQMNYVYNINFVNPEILSLDVLGINLDKPSRPSLAAPSLQAGPALELDLSMPAHALTTLVSSQATLPTPISDPLIPSPSTIMANDNNMSINTNNNSNNNNINHNTTNNNGLGIDVDKPSQPSLAAPSLQARPALELDPSMSAPASRTLVSSQANLPTPILDPSIPSPSIIMTNDNNMSNKNNMTNNNNNKTNNNNHMNNNKTNNNNHMNNTTNNNNNMTNNNNFLRLEPRFSSAWSCNKVIDFGSGMVARRQYRVLKKPDTDPYNLISYVQDYGHVQKTAHMATFGLSTHRVYHLMFLFDTSDILQLADKLWPCDTRLKNMPSLIQLLKNQDFARDKVICLAQSILQLSYGILTLQTAWYLRKYN